MKSKTEKPKRGVAPEPARQNPPKVRQGLIDSIFSKPRPPTPVAVQPKKAGGGATVLTMMRFYRRFSAVMPRKLSSYFEEKMRYAGISQEKSAIVLGRALLV